MSNEYWNAEQAPPLTETRRAAPSSPLRIAFSRRAALALIDTASPGGETASYIGAEPLLPRPSASGRLQDSQHLRYGCRQKAQCEGTDAERSRRRGPGALRRRPCARAWPPCRRAAARDAK